MQNRNIYQDAPEYYHYYFDLVNTDDLLTALAQNKQQTLAFLKNISEKQQHFSYAQGKWTINEVMQHIIDTERIFQYRAFRFSRKDVAELHGFNEDDYIDNIKDCSLNLADLINDFEAVRHSTEHLFKNMNDTMLDFRGTANKIEASARQLGFMIVGHGMHHLKVIEERYL
jgi:hypothetical protein